MNDNYKPIIHQYRRDLATNNIISQPRHEEIIVHPYNSLICLTEIPEEWERVKIINKETNENMSEVYNIEDIKEPSQFYVNYDNRTAYFHPDMRNKLMEVDYHGIGAEYFSADSIYTKTDSAGNVVETIQDILDSGDEAKQVIIEIGGISNVVSYLNALKTESEAILDSASEKINKLDEVNNNINNYKTDIDNKIKTFEDTTNKNITDFKSEIKTSVSEIKENANNIIEESKEEMNDNMNKNIDYLQQNLDSKFANLGTDVLCQINDIPNKIFPVGYVYQSINPTHPKDLFGGEWDELGVGQVLIGAGTYKDKNGVTKTFTVGQNYGEYEHTQTIYETPFKKSDSEANDYGLQPQGGFANRVPVSKNPSEQKSFNVIQPSAPVYRWVRTKLSEPTVDKLSDLVVEYLLNGSINTNNLSDGSVTFNKCFLFEAILSDKIVVDFLRMKIHINKNSYVFANEKSYRISDKDLEIQMPSAINSRAYLLTFNTVNKSLSLNVNNSGLFTSKDVLICYIYNNNVYGKNINLIDVIGNVGQLHDIDYVINKIINDQFNNIKVKFIGDSITAGVGSTGYGLTDIPIGTTGKFVPLQDSSCWANKLARRIEELYSNNTFILPSQITDSITSVSSSNKLSLLREQKYYIPAVGAKCFDYSFKGDSINIYFSKQAGSAIVGIYIDDNKIGDVDLYSSTAEYGFKYEINGLENGEHVLSIKCTGQNASSSSRRIYIEALEIPKKVTCVNYGISGITTESVVNWLDQLIETDDDVIIMQIGTNDRAFNDVSITLKNLRTIINYIKSKSKELILFCSSPTSKTDDEKSSHKLKMQRIVTCISKVAEENNIRFVNQYNYLSMYCKEKDVDINSLLKDGLHPNDTGYELMYYNACKELNIAVQQ